MPNPKTKKTDEPKFEQALARLEKIVEEMEAAEVPLDEMLKRYEEGVRLAKFCSSKLEDAQKKIEIMEKLADGSVKLKPFEEEDAKE